MGGCVHFTVADPDAARQIEAALLGLGYDARPDLGALEGDLYVAASRAAARRYRLTAREQQLFELLLRGLDRRAIGEALEISGATIKWHLHRVYAKLGVGGSEAALRKALFLDNDARWLRVPHGQRDALDRLVRCTEQVLRARKGTSGRKLDDALAELERELGDARRVAGLESLELVTGDDESDTHPIEGQRR